MMGHVMSDVTWLPVSGYEGHYEVGSSGDVRSVPRVVVYKNGKRFTYPSKVLRPATTKDGYRRVSLSVGDKSRSFLVHRLVALAFIPNPDGKPEVNHKRGAVAGDAVHNLEWVTPSENCRHAYDELGKIGPLLGRRGALHHLSKPVIVGGVRYGSLRLAAEAIGTSHGAIGDAIRRGGTIHGLRAAYALEELGS